MIGIIIAGGSGTRLWPLSTPDYPKHLLKLTDDNSLLQNTLERVRKLTTDDKIFIIPDSSHSHHVEQQLSDFPKDHFLAEPARRGTASCVLLAMRHIKKLGLDPEEPIAILWADHLIRDTSGFVESFVRAGKLAEKYEKVVFIGAEPLYASTGMGYMEHGAVVDHEQEAYNLIKFHEKPDHETAEKYFASGHYFWNMGYIVTSLKTFEKTVKEHAPAYDQAYEQLLTSENVQESYLQLESVALDYAFSEKLTDAIVMPGGFDWVDVGSFGDLHGISKQDHQGNHVSGEAVELDGVSNSYVRNETSTPVAVIGVDNVVVVNSPNGILVTNKNFAQKVGEVSKKFKQAS